MRKIRNFAKAYRLPKSDMGLWVGCRHIKKRLLSAFLGYSESRKFYQFESRM